MRIRICREEDGAWLVGLEAFPDYRTQGESQEDRKEHLEDLHLDLTSGVPQRDQG